MTRELRIPDYFSRNSIWGYGQPVVKDVFGKPVAMEGLVRLVEATTDRRRSEDPALLSIKEAASVDERY